MDEKEMKEHGLRHIRDIEDPVLRKRAEEWARKKHAERCREKHIDTLPYEIEIGTDV